MCFMLPAGSRTIFAPRCEQELTKVLILSSELRTVTSGIPVHMWVR